MTICSTVNKNKKYFFRSNDKLTRRSGSIRRRNAGTSYHKIQRKIGNTEKEITELAINISLKPLTEQQQELMEKGLNFISTFQNDKFDFMSDFHNFVEKYD